jgi:hypothetical protein
MRNERSRYSSFVVIDSEVNWHSVPCAIFQVLLVDRVAAGWLVGVYQCCVMGVSGTVE